MMNKLKMIPLAIALLAILGCSKNDDNGENETVDPNAIVTILDTNFKNALLNYNPVIDEDGDGEIQVREAEAITELWLSNEGIADFTGLNMFINLREFYCDNNANLNQLDISKNVKLTKLVANFTPLATIDLSKNTSLTTFDCYDCVNLENILFPVGNGENKIESLNIVGTQISSLETENFEQLKYLICRNTKLTEIDLSSNPLLEQLFAEENNLLTNVNIKNGHIDRISDLTLFDCPNLTTICVDDVSAANAKDPERWKKDVTAEYTANCN